MRQYLRRFKRKQDALYHGLRDSLLLGFPGPGERLPSSRQLAEQLGLSRGTVVVVFEMLESDGLVRLEPGRAPTAIARPEGSASSRIVPFQLSSWARRLPPAPGYALIAHAIDFSAGSQTPLYFQSASGGPRFTRLCASLIRRSPCQLPETRACDRQLPRMCCEGAGCKLTRTRLSL